MLQAKDIIAIIGLIGGFILMGMGINSVVGAILIAIIAYYFGCANLLEKGREPQNEHKKKGLVEEI